MSLRACNLRRPPARSESTFVIRARITGLSIITSRADAFPFPAAASATNRCISWDLESHEIGGCEIGPEETGPDETGPAIFRSVFL